MQSGEKTERFLRKRSIPQDLIVSIPSLSHFKRSNRDIELPLQSNQLIRRAIPIDNDLGIETKYIEQFHKDHQNTDQLSLSPDKERNRIDFNDIIGRSNRPILMFNNININTNLNRDNQIFSRAYSSRQHMISNRYNPSHLYHPKESLEMRSSRYFRNSEMNCDEFPKALFRKEQSFRPNLGSLRFHRERDHIFDSNNRNSLSFKRIHRDPTNYLNSGRTFDFSKKDIISKFKQTENKLIGPVFRKINQSERIMNNNKSNQMSLNNTEKCTKNQAQISKINDIRINNLKSLPLPTFFPNKCFKEPSKNQKIRILDICIIALGNIQNDQSMKYKALHKLLINLFMYGNANHYIEELSSEERGILNSLIFRKFKHKTRQE